ncbi:MAG: PAS domain-containing protein [Rhodocyclaceae bacterium]
MRDMMPDDVGGLPYQEYELTYFDGFKRRVLVTEREEPFPDGKLIVSRTDPTGVITHANESFVYMSGYGADELIGQQHYILRHPDMPKAGFKDLWDTITQGRKWHGYVKNLRKDGAFYWVSRPSCRTCAMARSSAIPRYVASPRAARSMKSPPSMPVSLPKSEVENDSGGKFRVATDDQSGRQSQVSAWLVHLQCLVAKAARATLSFPRLRRFRGMPASTTS